MNFSSKILYNKTFLPLYNLFQATCSGYLKTQYMALQLEPLPS